MFGVIPRGMEKGRGSASVQRFLLNHAPETTGWLVEAGMASEQREIRLPLGGRGGVTATLPRQLHSSDARRSDRHQR